MLLSVLWLQIEGAAHRIGEAEATVGRVRKGVVEGRERLRADDVELEVLIEPASATVTLTRSADRFH